MQIQSQETNGSSFISEYTKREQSLEWPQEQTNFSQQLPNSQQTGNFSREVELPEISSFQMVKSMEDDSDEGNLSELDVENMANAQTKVE